MFNIHLYVDLITGFQVLTKSQTCTTTTRERIYLSCFTSKRALSYFSGIHVNLEGQLFKNFCVVSNNRLALDLMSTSLSEPPFLNKG
jgi:hypothetical protein